MDEEIIYRYINGTIRPIKIKKEMSTNQYMNNKIRNNNQDKKEQYFNENFYMQDAKHENTDDDKYWNEQKKGYIKHPGLIEKKISTYDKKTGKEVGRLTYNEIYSDEAYNLYDKNTHPNRINVEGMYVTPEYQRKGIATQMYKELQNRAGDDEIFFGELTKEGKKLLNSIGEIRKGKIGASKLDYYWGKIKK